MKHLRNSIMLAVLVCASVCFAQTPPPILPLPGVGAAQTPVQITPSGVITSYNGESTQGVGIDYIVFSTNSYAQSATGGATVYTAPTNGVASYCITGEIICTNASGAGSPTVTTTISYTNELGAASQALFTTFALSATGRSSMTPYTFSMTNGSTFSYTNTINSPAGSPKFNLRLKLQRI